MVRGRRVSDAPTTSQQLGHFEAFAAHVLVAISTSTTSIAAMADMQEMHKQRPKNCDYSQRDAELRSAN
jgi:hypothetical protein